MPTPRAPEREVDEPMAMTWSVGRVLAVATVVAMVIFWVWIFSGGPRRANPDHLQDQAFVEQAEQRCRQLRAELKQLPAAEDVASAAERADVLDQANALLGAMIDDLAAMAPTSGDDQEVVEHWLADYRTYLSDRETYAAALRTDPDAQLLITENERLRDPVDKTIQVFTKDANDMEACNTPGDVG